MWGKNLLNWLSESFSSVVDGTLILIGAGVAVSNSILCVAMNSLTVDKQKISIKNLSTSLGWTTPILVLEELTGSYINKMIKDLKTISWNWLKEIRNKNVEDLEQLVVEQKAVSNWFLPLKLLTNLAASTVITYLNESIINDQPVNLENYIMSMPMLVAISSIQLLSLPFTYIFIEKTIENIKNKINSSNSNSESKNKIESKNGFEIAFVLTAMLVTMSTGAVMFDKCSNGAVTFELKQIATAIGFDIVFRTAESFNQEIFYSTFTECKIVKKIFKNFFSNETSEIQSPANVIVVNEENDNNPPQPSALSQETVDSFINQEWRLPSISSSTSNEAVLLTV